MSEYSVSRIDMHADEVLIFGMHESALATVGSVLGRGIEQMGKRAAPIVKQELNLPGAGTIKHPYFCVPHPVPGGRLTAYLRRWCW